MDKTKRNIFLIGGGEITKKETIEVDKAFLKEVGGARSAKILFFPTAANDSEGYIQGFSEYFSALGCKKIESAKLNSESQEKIKEKIDRASIIYLGGGSTKLLIDTFREKNIVEFLKIFLKEEKVLVGMSAGACALGGIAPVSEIEEDIQLEEGWNILPEAIILPHYKKDYQDTLDQVKARYPQKHVFGIPEGSAVHIKSSRVEFMGKVVEK